MGAEYAEYGRKKDHGSIERLLREVADFGGLSSPGLLCGAEFSGLERVLFSPDFEQVTKMRRSHGDCNDEYRVNCPAYS